jgi:hypothetical protein
MTAFTTRGPLEKYLRPFRNPQLFGKITSDVATANIQGEPLMNLQLRLSW